MLCTTIFYGVATIVAGQRKDGLYHNQFLVDMFFPLAIEFFRFLHEQVKGFLHQCANMVWEAKALEAFQSQFYAHFIGKGC